MIFFTTIWKTKAIDKFFLTNIARSYKIRIYHRIFFGGGIISPPKISRNYLWWSGFLNEIRTAVYRPELYKTRLHAISLGCFEIAAPKSLENCQKNVWVEFPFNRVSQIQSTAYCRTVLQIHSTSAQKGKNVLKFQKIAYYPFFTNATALQSRISASANTGSKKNVSFECSGIVGSLPQKSLL